MNPSNPTTNNSSRFLFSIPIPIGYHVSFSHDDRLYLSVVGEDPAQGCDVMMISSIQTARVFPENPSYERLLLQMQQEYQIPQQLSWAYLWSAMEAGISQRSSNFIVIRRKKGMNERILNYISLLPSSSSSFSIILLVKKATDVRKTPNLYISQVVKKR